MTLTGHVVSAVDAFLDQLTIHHGPAELLGRFFVKATEEAAERGVFLQPGTFAELYETNQKNRDSWFPITTTFRPCLGGADDTTGFVLLGRNLAGEIVVTFAGRMYDWRGTNFKNEAESARLFYADTKSVADDEAYIVNAAEAESITGNVMYTGGVWFHPDFRGNKMSTIIPRLGRAYGLSLFGYDMLCCLITPTNTKSELHNRTGLRGVDPGSVILRNTPSLPGGDLAMTLAHQSADDVVDDAFKFLVTFGTEVDVGVRRRYG